MKTWRKGKPGCFCARFDEEWKATELWQDRGWAKCGKQWATQQGLCPEIPSIIRDKDASFLWVQVTSHISHTSHYDSSTSEEMGENICKPCIW